MKGFTIGDFSLDGCTTRHDVDARRELVTNAARHQQRAHKFGPDDRRQMPVRGADVPPARMLVAPGALRRVERIIADADAPCSDDALRVMDAAAGNAPSASGWYA
jgi:hypothetical protein